MVNLAKHDSAESISSLIPPPPRLLGMSPPTISVSSREHPAPVFRLSGPLLVAGMQKPSPLPQYPKLIEKKEKL